MTPAAPAPLASIPVKDCHKLLREKDDAHEKQDVLREASHAAQRRALLYVIGSLFTLVTGILGLRAYLGPL